MTENTQQKYTAEEAECRLVADCLAYVLTGKELSEKQVYGLAELTTEAGRRALEDAAAQVQARFGNGLFDMCSIVNARSGKCPENCKWCAQSAHYSTGCETYDMVDEAEAQALARGCAEHGIMRFSYVASGRAVRGKALDAMCAAMRRVKDSTGVSVCASLGLLGREELAKLKEIGLKRYHCNLESAPSHFPTLCTTHTIEDKMATIDAAHSLGLEVCSGGIIGMGETARQRGEFALLLRRARPVSIPINVLCPIPGTPLAGTPLISEDEIVHTAALFRMVHPGVQLRFAGGRQRISREGQLRCMRAGVNGAIVGDLLTTIGSTVAADRDLAREAGYELGYEKDSL